MFSRRPQSQASTEGTTVKQLRDFDAFDSSTKKVHASFPNVKRNVLKTLEEEKLKERMMERFSGVTMQDNSDAGGV